MSNVIYTDNVAYTALNKDTIFLTALYDCPIGHSFFWPESVMACNNYKCKAITPFRDRGVVKMKSATDNGVKGCRVWVNAGKA